MAYHGDIAVNQTLYFTFTTNSAGVPTVLAGTPVLSVYKDDSTTQTTTGPTLVVSLDGVVGLNSVKIETTDAFYAAAHDYSVVITTGTVGGVSAVGYVVGSFSIANRAVNVSQWAGTAVHAPGTAGVPLVDIHDQATALIDPIWDEVVSTGHAVASSPGKLIYDNLNAPVGTVDTVVDTLTTNLADLHTDVGTAITNIGTVLTDTNAIHVHAQAIIDDVALVHTHVGTIDGHIGADYTATEKSAIDLLDDAVGGLVDVHTDVGTAITNIGTVLTDTNAIHVHAQAIIDDVALVHTHVGTIDGHVTADYTATEKSAIDLLDDAVGGLVDVHTDVGTAITDIAAVHVHVGTIDGHVTADYTATEKSAIDLLDDAVGGLVDVHTDVGTAITDIAAVHVHAGTIETDVAAVHVHVGTIDGHITADYTATEKAAIDLLDDAVAGLVDIHTDIAAIPTAAVPTANAIADQVWDEVLSGHTGAGSAGLALAGASAPSAASVADAVWDEAAADHVATGSTGKALANASAAGDPWSTLIPGSYLSGTAGYALDRIDDTLAGIDAQIDASTVTITSPVVGSTITVYRDTTWSIGLTLLGAIATDDVLYWSVKRNAGDVDADALVRISRAGGLLRLNKAAATTSTDGSITVTNAGTGALTITVKPAANAVLDAMTSLAWDIKRITAAGVASELTAGAMNIEPAVTRAVA